MIRQPSSLLNLYAWHNAALAARANGSSRDQVVHAEEPQCGWYRTRMVRGGPWIPARIFLERTIDPETGELADDERLVCEVGGARRDPWHAWPSLANRPITRAEHDRLVAERDRSLSLQATHIPFDLTRDLELLRP